MELRNAKAPRHPSPLQSTTMRVAIGSTRSPKVDAVREAFKVFSSAILSEPDEAIEFSGFDVPSGISRMPMSLAELMAGAQGRAENLILQLKREKAEADFYVGLEGGFHVIEGNGPRPLVFLESWAYATDGHRGSFGQGGGVAVPPAIADPVLDRGTELGIIIDRFCKDKGIGDRQGTWGVLTRDILDRKHSFVIALLAAFAPFYNPEAYR